MLVGDLFYATLTILGVSILLPQALLQVVLLPLGAVLLLYLGFASLRDGMRGL